MRLTVERVNWRFVIGEAFLIVVGILIALGIDSYMGRRSEAAEAEAYLRDLALELRSDSTELAARLSHLDRTISSATTILRILEDGDAGGSDVGNLLLGSLSGEGITLEPVVWEGLRSTGGLRLVQDSDVRSAVVSHYLNRASRFRTIDENFVPASRALRALAWDIMPIESFPSFMQTGRSAVANEAALSGLRGRDDAEFLLKRLILTGYVARASLESVAARTTELIRLLES